MVFVQVAARVAECGEFTSEESVIFGAVHFDEEDGAMFAEKACSTLEDGTLGPLDIAFEEVRERMGRDVVVERDAFDRDLIRN